MITRRTLMTGMAGLAGSVALLPLAARAGEWERPGDMAIGAPDAPITVIEYFSLTCSHCQWFHNNTFPELKASYIETGKVRFVARDFPLNRPALHAAILAHCAGAGQYFAFIETLFKTYDDWTRASDYMKILTQIGQLGGVSKSQFRDCLDDQALEARLLDSILKAQQEYGVSSTPTFIVNGKKHEGALRIERFAKILDRLLPDV